MEDHGWEQVKENVQLERSGHSIESLNSFYKDEPWMKKKQNQHVQQEWEDKIKRMNAPLETWLDYLKWIKDIYPTGSELYFSTLEKCTRHFQSHPTYQNDTRYIHLWISLADHIRDDDELYKFLYSQEIGKMVSVFYMAWADVKEKMGKDAIANQIYEKGFKVGAQPIELLRQRHLEFQARLGKRYLQKLEKDGEEVEFPLGSRNTLGHLSKRGARSEHRPSSAMQQGLGRNTTTQHQVDSNNTEFAVFEDEAYNDVPSIRSPAQSRSVLPRRQEGSKENTQEPSTWNNAALDGMLSRPVISSLEVYEEEDSTDKEQEHLEEKEEKEPSVAPSFRSRPVMTESERLSINPILERQQKKPSSTVIHPESIYLQARFTAEDGEHISMEELRADQWKKEHATQIIETHKTNAFGMIYNDEECMFNEPSTIKGQGVSSIQDPTWSCGGESVEDTTRQLNFSGLSSMSTISGQTSRKVEPDDDITINTKLAMEDMNAIFGDFANDGPVQAENIPSASRATPLVERQLEFSVFEDDETLQGPSDPELRTNGARIPLQSREDIVASSSRLTNKDALAKAMEQVRAEQRPLSMIVEEQDDDSQLQGSVIRTTFPIVHDPFSKKPHVSKVLALLAYLPHVFVNSCNKKGSMKSSSSKMWMRDLAMSKKNMLGKGICGKVYAIQFNGINMAMKREEHPACTLPWEYYIIHQYRLRQLHPKGVVEFNSLHVSDDATLLLMEHGTGTIQDLVNTYRKRGKCIPEGLVWYYTKQMLDTIESFHAVDLLHGDIKPDNFILTNGTCDAVYGGRVNETITGSNVILIDFGRSIDRRLFPKKTQFQYGEAADEFTCIEMQQGLPWTTQVDLFALASVIHFMLFGCYMTYEKHQESWRIIRPFKRYWNGLLWEDLFDTLLNITSTSSCTLSQFTDRIHIHLQRSSPSISTLLKTLP